MSGRGDDPDQVRFDASLWRLVVPSEAVVHCDEDLRQCSGSFEVRVDYCGAGFVRLRRAALFGAGIAGQGWSQLIVSSGESRSTTITFSGRGISVRTLTTRGCAEQRQGLDRASLHPRAQPWRESARSLRVVRVAGDGDRTECSRSKAASAARATADDAAPMAAIARACAS